MTDNKPIGGGPEHAAEADSFAFIFYRALNKLAPREMEIIIAHFGLDGSVAPPRRQRSQMSRWQVLYQNYYWSGGWDPPLFDEPSDALLSRLRRWDEENGRYESLQDVFYHFKSGMTKLQKEFTSQGLLEMQTDSISPRILARYRPKSCIEPSPLVHCEYHGEWFDPDDPLTYLHGRCGACPCPLQQARVGRRRLYCSTKCRNAASLQRRKING